MSEHSDVIQPKPDEHIYAQTAAYAAEQVSPHSGELAKDIGGTATAFLGNETVTTTHENIMGNKTEVEHTPADYVSFLRGMDQETRSDVGFLTQKMQAHNAYKSAVDEALNEASEGDEHYLGRGSNGKAFMFEQDGEKYAVKTGGVSYRDVRAFNRAKDIEGISHLIAMDLDTKRSVMNLVPGIEAPRLTSEERLAIPKEHMAGVIDKSLELYNAGIHIDPKPSNFLYDQDKGFGIIDYGVLDNSEWTRAAQVMGTTRMLTFKNRDPDGPKYGTPEYEAHEHERHTEAVVILNRFLDAMEEDHPEIIQEAAKEQAAINADALKSGGDFYPIYAMPIDTPELVAFKDRIIALGLQGQEPKPPMQYDDADEDGVW